ncbi:MAG TPA: hypothetical protein G4N94_09270 [Caldilineae bacterium]|nr:hypothetical protein [Caldilineae bacterium]
MKKILLTITVLMMAAFVISACSQNEPPAPTATPETMAKVDDSMQNVDAMKNDEMAEDTMAKDDMQSQDEMKKDDAMDKDENMAAEESMEKDENMEQQNDAMGEDEDMKKDDESMESDSMEMEDDKSSDEAMKEEDMMEKTQLNLAFQGLGNPGEGWAYEGWLIVDGEPVTTGVFTVDDKGMASATDFPVDAHALKNATAFVLTIEPSPDPDPAPNIIHLIGGDFDGDSATLAVSHPLALSADFADITGSYIIGAPSSKMAAEDYRKGIWWPSLALPALPDGWIYEGWVVGPDGPISTGRFASGDVTDSDGNGPTAGPNPGPSFPGQDFIDPAIDLTTGYAAVITIEPEPDTAPAPSFLKLLVDKNIEDVGDHGSQDVENQANTFPTGMAKR